MLNNAVIIKPATMFLLNLYPFDLATKPNIMDPIVRGVKVKNIHIFSVNNPFLEEIRPQSDIAKNMDASDKIKSITDIMRHEIGAFFDDILDGFLYM